MYITRLASKEIFSPSNKIYGEVGRAKDLSTPRYTIKVRFLVHPGRQVTNTGLIPSSLLFTFPFQLDSCFQDFSYFWYLWLLVRFIGRFQCWIKSEETMCTDTMTSVLFFAKIGHCSVYLYIVENWFAQRFRYKWFIDFYVPCAFSESLFSL